MRNNIDDLNARAAASGFDVRLASADRLEDLRLEIERRISTGEVNGDFARERLGHFQFSPVFDGRRPASLIITATPQPEQQAVFRYQGREHRYLIPPTYTWDTDAPAEAALRDFLAPLGFTLYPAVIPLKLAAVRTGLARYGRNNITYHESYGSYFRLKAFFSDMPAASDAWTEETWLPECANCAACARACPTAAITTDREVIRAERCLTYFNERPEDFPEWVKPSWFTCLVGCLYCQLACPVDRDRDIRPRETFTFSEEETSILITAQREDDLTPPVRDRLERMWLLEDWQIIARNLRELLGAGGK